MTDAQERPLDGMNGFLSLEEIEKLTGSAKPSLQIQLLKRRRFPHFVIDGKPVVVRSVVEARKAEEDARKPLDPVVEAFASLGANTLLGMSRAWDEISGVYFLFDDGRIVYVGCSTNIRNRLSEHTKKKFNGVAWIVCPLEYMEPVELLYIRKFMPKYNRAGLTKIRSEKPETRAEIEAKEG